jgi:hypothetical protein
LKEVASKRPEDEGDMFLKMSAFTGVYGAISQEIDFSTVYITSILRDYKKCSAFSRVTVAFLVRWQHTRKRGP